MEQMYMSDQDREDEVDDEERGQYMDIAEETFDPFEGEEDSIGAYGL